MRRVSAITRGKSREGRRDGAVWARRFYVGLSMKDADQYRRTKAAWKLQLLLDYDLPPSLRSQENVRVAR